MATTPSQLPPFRLDYAPFRWFLDAPGVAATGAAGAGRLLPFAVAYAAAHGLLVAAGLLLSTVPVAAVSIWPAVGLLCAILAATPARSWPLWIAASVVGRVVFELVVFDKRELLAPLLFSAVNAVEAAVFATFLQKPLVQAWRQGRPLYLSVAITIFAFAAAGLGGLFGATALQALGSEQTSFWQALRLWAAGDFVGIILVTPLAIWLMLPQIRIPRELAGWPECVAMPVVLLALVALATWLAPGPDFPYRSAAETGLAAMLALPVLWAALRADFPMVALLQILLAVAVVLVSMNGYGPFAHDVAGYLPALASLQAFLVVTVITLTVISFAVLERHNARQQAGLHQRFTDLLVHLTGKLMAAGSETLDDVISESLQLIGQFGSADRCVLLQIDAPAGSILRTHAWTGEGVAAHPPELTDANLQNFPWVVEQFRKRGFVVLENLDRQLPEGAEELDIIRRAVPDTVSAIYVGLFTDDELIGTIGFGYARRGQRWSHESVSLMYLVGQLFANILTRKKTENELRSYQQKLRSLATDLAVTEERSRRRTATDLHDGIGQNLAVARMKLGQLLAAGDGDRAELTQVRNLVDEALRGTRYLIADLSPTILYELGLVPALQSLAERFEPANDLSCRLSESGEPWEPGNDLRIAVYRAVQECLKNVARHAQAEHVEIDVHWEAERLDIEVRDDGVGFDAAVHSDDVPDVSGFGLFSMRESLALHGGTLQIDTTRGIGTSIRLCVPRQQEDAQ